MYISLSTNVMDDRLQIIANALAGNTTSLPAIGSSSSSLSQYVNAGNFTIVIYSGTIPTNADTVLGTDNLPLAEIVIPNTSVQIPTNGTLTITGEPFTSAPAVNSGTATFARIYNSAGNVVMDADCGISGSTIILASPSILQSTVVTLTSMQFSEYA